MKKIKLSKLKVKTNAKGDVIKLIQKNKNNKFGELYISIIKKKQIKGWKLHSRMNIHLFVIKGKVKFVFYNSRIRKHKIIVVSEKNNKRIFIPNNTWFAFKNLSNTDSKILSFTDILHSKKESKNVDLDFFNFAW